MKSLVVVLIFVAAFGVMQVRTCYITTAIYCLTSLA